jgi:glucose/arabinose dehydrogenase
LLLGITVAVSAQTVALQSVVPGLDRPVSIAHARDDRLFIVLQAGEIVIWNGTTLLPTAFLDIRDLVTSSGERGLLGLAFHPDYTQNGFFYVNYTDNSGDTVVARYSVSASDPNRADRNSARTLLHIDQPYSNHNGGQLQFGPDGYLYIGMGDGGSGGDPENRAQNRTQLLGKMLRIDVDTGSPYGIPATNPFVGQTGARPEIWALGLRNPWRFTFDRVTGDLWIADVGQGSIEEIDFQPASSRGGENYGWKIKEGSNCFVSNCSSQGLVDPVIEYGHTNGACSVTGGYVYRGTRTPRLTGTYIYGDYCSGVIWGATRNANGTFTSRVLVNSSLFISTFGEDVNGEVYVADHRGAVYRIIDTAPLPRKMRSVRR